MKTDARAGRAFMTIGEVLGRLREEFPDISISKIRFLETEGLLEPERTPSGYRKFYEQDLMRLRDILRLQRDHFMPLKVIRKRLERSEATAPGEPPGDSEIEENAPALALAEEEPEDLVAGLMLSFEELVASSGLKVDQLRELEEYGLIGANRPDGMVHYDEDDLMVAKIARDFGKYGIQPRHMKMYGHFADRESGLFEQALLPSGRTGGNDSQRRLAQSLNDLAKLSKRLRHLLLRAKLRKHLQ
ncbi:MAG: transcriptional regulator FtsR [Actinomycetota bacterium]